MQRHSRASLDRYRDWLRAEIQVLPRRHPLHTEYSEQLADLTARRAG